MPRMAEINLDFDKLLQLGIPGMLESVAASHRNAALHNGNVVFYDGLRSALEILVACCDYYAGMAVEKATAAGPDSTRGRELSDMARSLIRIKTRKPESLGEAIQLFWLYGVLAGVDNYGRMDVCLGDFFAHDIESGALSAEDALSLVQSL